MEADVETSEAHVKAERQRKTSDNEKNKST